MAHDLIIGSTNRDWSRSSRSGEDAPARLMVRSLDDDAEPTSKRSPARKLFKSLDDGPAKPSPRKSHPPKLFETLDGVPFMGDEERAQGEDSGWGGTVPVLTDTPVYAFQKTPLSVAQSFAVSPGSPGRASALPAQSSKTSSKDNASVTSKILRIAEKKGWPVYVTSGEYWIYQKWAKEGNKQAIQDLATLDHFILNKQLIVSDDHLDIKDPLSSKYVNIAGESRRTINSARGWPNRKEIQMFIKTDQLGHHEIVDGDMEGNYIPYSAPLISHISHVLYPDVSVVSPHGERIVGKRFSSIWDLEHPLPRAKFSPPAYPYNPGKQRLNFMYINTPHSGVVAKRIP